MDYQAIMDNWETDIEGSAQSIRELHEAGYPSWTVRFHGEYGVAIPYRGTEEINESFANASLKSSIIMLSSGESIPSIVLTTNNESIRRPFASFCVEFINPGQNGSQRLLKETDPLNWWYEWKTLLGNRDIDEMIYDTLGELCALYYSALQDGDSLWNGPSGATYDIETNQCFYEVKSTLNREKNEVTISNQFQLFPPQKPLKLILCRFEPVQMSGVSIETMLEKFTSIGYNVDDINSKLSKKGMEKGRSSRKREFILHEMLLYDITDDFPRITPESFVGGVLPHGIVKITYTVDLSGLPAVSLLQGGVI